MPLSENQKSIAMWREGRKKLFDLITNVLKKARTKQQQHSTAVELFKDDFVAETGIDVTTPAGKAALENAMLVHIERRLREREQRYIAQEWREFQGPLGGLDDEPMGELPGDEEIAGWMNQK